MPGVAEPAGVQPEPTTSWNPDPTPPVTGDATTEPVNPAGDMGNTGGAGGTV